MTSSRFLLANISITREFSGFTREFSSFTREFLTFTREFIFPTSSR